MNNIPISGAIGASFLKKNNKKIIIFYDDHSNTKYCNSSYFIDNFFNEVNSHFNDSVILLEEPFINNDDNVVFLWNDIPHVIKSKEFYKKIVNKNNGKKVCRVFPVDIRLCLIDVSLEEYLPETIEDDLELIEKLKSGDLSELDITEDDIKIIGDLKLLEEKIKDHIKIADKYDETISGNNKNELELESEPDTVNNYFKYFMYLFNCGDIDTQKFKKDSNIKLIKSIFDNQGQNVLYVKIKQKFIAFYEKFIEPNKSIEMKEFVSKYSTMTFEYKEGFPFKDDDEDNFISQFNRIHNSMMELYAIIIIERSDLSSIVLYSGYYHSNNVCCILKNHFDYVEEKAIGTTKNIDEIEENKLGSCVHIDKNMALKYLNKPSDNATNEES